MWFDDLKKYCDACGVSGFEKEAAEIIAADIKPYCDELYYDKVGNLVAVKKGTAPTRKPIVYLAHLDEVGMMIRHIGDDGTLLFDQVGIMADVLQSKRVLVGPQHIRGLIGAKPVHLQKEKGKKAPEIDEMYIDIGVSSREEAEKMGVYAAYAAFENDFHVFGTDGAFVRSKALDDRIGCTVMAQMIKNGVKHDSVFVFTLGEELGGVGALAATREFEPEVAIILESTTASDLPCNKGADAVCSLGNGAVVPFMDGGTRYDHTLYKRIRALAAENGIKTQTKTRVAGGTDAASVQRAVGGVRVAAVSLPCRYIHSSSCVAARADMESMQKLVACIDENADTLIG